MPQYSFIEEIKRRHVVRAAIAHVVVAWLFVQIADVVLPYIGIVDQPVRWALVVSVATFPLTIVLAWFFEHPWRDHAMGRVALDLLLIGAIAAGAGLWAVGNVPEGARTRTSIVVLPFDHSGAPGEQGLSRALSYEIGSLLTKSKSIDVIGFESSNSSELDGLGAIAVAGILKVANVLEGSVSASDDRMRVDLELVDKVGAVLWRTVIEDSFDNLYAVQARIAAQIEARLGTGDDTVPVEEIAAGRCWKPADPAALEKYYTARYYVELRTETEIARQQMRDAIQLYEELIETYPKFAEARSGLAWALHLQRTYDREHALPDEERGGVMRALAERALADCPTLGEAMHILPNEYDHPNAWLGAYRQLTAFIEMQPEMPENYQRLVRHYRETGLIDRAMEIARQRYAVNPLSVKAIKQLANLVQVYGDIDEAIALYDRATELGSTGPNFARMSKDFDACQQDVDCIIDNSGMQHLAPIREQLRTMYREPASDADTRESIEAGLAAFHATDGEVVNWLTGSICNAGHLAPLFFELWDATLAMREKTGDFMRPYWYMPNVWNRGCEQVLSHPRFPAFAEQAQLVDYWREVGFPAGFEETADGLVFTPPARK